MHYTWPQLLGEHGGEGVIGKENGRGERRGGERRKWVESWEGDWVRPGRRGGETGTREEEEEALGRAVRMKIHS